VCAATAGLALITACSSASQSPSASNTTAPAPASGRHIVVHANNMLRFMPAKLSVPTGTVHVTLIDDGSYPHDILVPGLHVRSKTVTGSLGAQRTMFTVHFAKAGTYPFECTYHDTAGMRGEFVVRG
jgi:plastocyanin